LSVNLNQHPSKLKIVKKIVLEVKLCVMWSVCLTLLGKTKKKTSEKNLKFEKKKEGPKYVYKKKNHTHTSLFQFEFHFLFSKI